MHYEADSHTQEEYISDEVLFEAIRKLKNGKSPGRDKITTKMIKYCDEKRFTARDFDAGNERKNSPSGLANRNNDTNLEERR